MCGRYSFFNDEELYDRFKVLRGDWELRDHYNVAPSQDMPVITNDGKENHIEIMRWGLIPHWAKDYKIGYKMINARAETIGEKPSFKRPLQRQRCLVPARGFFEWQRSKVGKQPYFIHLDDGDFFAFAGLYDIWDDPVHKQKVRSYTIITTDANEVMTAIHDRMPVILPRVLEREWLDPSISDIEVLRDMLRPIPADHLELYPVSPLVNKPTNDTPEVLKPKIKT